MNISRFHMNILFRHYIFQKPNLNFVPPKMKKLKIDK